MHGSEHLVQRVVKVGICAMALGLPSSAPADDLKLLIGAHAEASVWQFDGMSGGFERILVEPGSGGLNQLQDIAVGPDGAL